VQDDGVHPNERSPFNSARLKNGPMTDRDLLLEDSRPISGGVNDDIILNAGSGSDLDSADIPAQHGSEPDACLLTHADVTNEYGRGRHERGRGDFRSFSIVGNDHGVFTSPRWCVRPPWLRRHSHGA